MTDDKREKLKDSVGTTVGEDGRVRADMARNAKGGDASKESE